MLSNVEFRPGRRRIRRLCSATGPRRAVFPRTCYRGRYCTWVIAVSRMLVATWLKVLSSSGLEETKETMPA